MTDREEPEDLRQLQAEHEHDVRQLQEIETLVEAARRETESALLATIELTPDVAMVTPRVRIMRALVDVVQALEVVRIIVAAEEFGETPPAS
jgi:hypothetical protein